MRLESKETSLEDVIRKSQAERKQDMRERKEFILVKHLKHAFNVISTKLCVDITTICIEREKNACRHSFFLPSCISPMMHNLKLMEFSIQEGERDLPLQSSQNKLLYT